MKIIYWKGDKFRVGKLLEYPEIMTQGETLAELEENMKDACMLMTMEEVPENHAVKERFHATYSGHVNGDAGNLVDIGRCGRIESDKADEFLRFRASLKSIKGAIFVD